MRTDVKVATLSLVVVLGACNTRQEPATGLSEDLKRDLAVAAASAGDLATAPSAFKPAQVVSSVEMTRARTPAPRLVASKRRTPKAVRAEAVERPASDAVADPAVKSAEADAPSPTPVSLNDPTESAPVAVVETPTPEPTPVATPSSTGSGGGSEGRGEGDGAIGDRGRGGGIGGIIGVVIRGGLGGVDKCDPRTDGRRRRGGIFRGRVPMEGGIGIDGGGIVPIGRGTFPTRL